MHFLQCKEISDQVFRNVTKEQGSTKALYWSAKTQRVAIEDMSTGQKAGLDASMSPFHGVAFTDSHDWRPVDIGTIKTEIIVLLELTEYRPVAGVDKVTGAPNPTIRKKERTRSIQGQKYTQVYLTKHGEKILRNVRLPHDTYRKFMEKRAEKTFSEAIRNLVRDFIIYHQQEQEPYEWMDKIYNQEIK